MFRAELVVKKVTSISYNVNDTAVLLIMAVLFLVLGVKSFPF